MLSAPCSRSDDDADSEVIRAEPRPLGIAGTCLEPPLPFPLLADAAHAEDDEDNVKVLLGDALGEVLVAAAGADMARSAVQGKGPNGNTPGSALRLITCETAGTVGPSRDPTLSGGDSP